MRGHQVGVVLPTRSGSCGCLSIHRPEGRQHAVHTIRTEVLLLGSGNRGHQGGRKLMSIAKSSNQRPAMEFQGENRVVALPCVHSSAVPMAMLVTLLQIIHVVLVGEVDLRTAIRIQIADGRPLKNKTCVLLRWRRCSMSRSYLPTLIPCCTYLRLASGAVPARYDWGYEQGVRRQWYDPTSLFRFLNYNPS